LKIKEKPEDFTVAEVSRVTHTRDDCFVFTLEKTGWDTIGVIKVMARNLGVSQKRFGYAGLKDRQAVTKQKVSVSGVGREQLEALEIPHVKISDIERGDRIRLGDHRGNTFDILVRESTLVSENVRKIERGFPNYFGQQRFGDVRPITHEVGRELIRQNFENAALIFLAKPFQKEKYFRIREELWETQNFEKAKKEYPLQLRYERAMLDRIHLGFKEAFKALPLRLNTLFIHAYQAYLFNEILRIRCGYVPFSDVEPGDVVIGWINRRKVLTLAGKHNMKRIEKEGLCAAAPIVGYKTQVRGRMKDIVKSLLEKEGVRKEKFRIREFPSLSNRGTYREILGKASDFSYAVSDEGTRLKFFLPKGQYATVFLKELFKST
jgi:tRNA pseudouridine13 synthase